MAETKKTNPWFWIIIGFAAVGLIGVFFTEPEPVKKSAKRSVKKSTTVAATTGDLRPEDYDAKFAPLNDPTKNAFKPGVVRLTGGPGLPDGIPSAFTGGDGTWIYTGTVEVDGVTQALIENQTNGEGVYLKQGEKWRNTTVMSISETELGLTGPDGELKKIPIGMPSVSAPATLPLPVPGAPGQVLPAGVQPGAIRGAIGQNDLSSLDASAMGDGTMGRGGRRGRRGGRGGQGNGE